MKPRLLILMTVILFCRTAIAGIIPSPQSRTFCNGYFTLDPRTAISADTASAPLAIYLQEYLPIMGFCGQLFTAQAIVMQVDPELAEEAYRLSVQPERIEITGGGYGGVFNGIQTLFQLLPSDVYAKQLQLPVKIACQKIEDAPRYSYRGQHLDVARTWMDESRVKRYIDFISYHKINKLHFHLTDDEGWRIEIRSHPELATIGGFRGGDSPIRAIYGKWDEKYGGYFTQDEIKELIAYAAIRNVEIIPEIDLPGHSRTIARIHPEILCNYTPDTAPSNGYDERSAWCVAREENYALLEDILTEVCELFPSKYIHIGGDEVQMEQWMRCPDCRALMQREGMCDPAQLQRLFMTRMMAILEKNGKYPAVWNEAIRGGQLPQQSRVHGWENLKACREATSQGYRTVVMPGEYFYFDMRQSAHEPGHNWAAIFDARKVYSFDPASLGFTAAEIKHIEGFEGAFWSEIPVSQHPETPDYTDYMLFPRVCALAERCWNENPPAWEEFYRTLTGSHYDRMSAMGIRFRLSPPAVSFRDGVLQAGTDDGSALFYRLETDSVWSPYQGPIRTDHPERYLFESRKGSGQSPEVGAPQFYRTIQPPVRITSSMPAGSKSPFARAEQYKAFARTTRTCRPGDWVLFSFDNPVRCREIFVQTGYLQLPRLIFNSGYAEVSYDGQNFEQAGALEQGSITIRPEGCPVYAIRITATCPDNGSSSVIIQPLRIKP